MTDLQLQQHHPTARPPAGSSEEAEIWSQHPSRIDVHGLGACQRCGRPSPKGELQLWGHCSFCRRADLQ